MLFYMCFCIIYTGNHVSQNPFEQFGVRADPKQSCVRTGRQSERAAVTAWRQLRVRGRHKSAGGSLWVSSSQPLALPANSDAGAPGTHRCERQSCRQREPAVVCGRLSRPPCDLTTAARCGWLAESLPMSTCRQSQSWFLAFLSSFSSKFGHFFPSSSYGCVRSNYCNSSYSTVFT